MSIETPQPPEHLSRGSATFWRQVAAEYHLEPHHQRFLEAACVAWDRMVTAREAIEEHGLLLEGRYGLKANPALAVERDARTAFVRAMRELDLDAEATRHITTKGR